MTSLNALTFLLLQFGIKISRELMFLLNTFQNVLKNQSRNMLYNLSEFPWANSPASEISVYELHTFMNFNKLILWTSLPFRKKKKPLISQLLPTTESVWLKLFLKYASHFACKERFPLKSYFSKPLLLKIGSSDIRWASLALGESLHTHQP